MDRQTWQQAGGLEQWMMPLLVRCKFGCCFIVTKGAFNRIVEYFNGNYFEDDYFDEFGTGDPMQDMMRQMKKKRGMR